MDLIWNPLLSQSWSAFHHQQFGSLQQSWAYGEALRSLGIEVIRVAALEHGQWRAMAQFIGRRFLWYISVASCSRGPVFDPDLDLKQRHDFYRRVRAEIPLRPLKATLFSPNQPQAHVAESDLKGMHRVMTGYSTVLLDLARSPEALRADLDGKWRNRLVKAEGSAGLKIFFQPSRTHCQTLLDEEAKQRKTRGFFGLPTEFVNAYIGVHDKPAQAFRVVWAEKDRRLLAGMLFLLHGSVATYHMGWSNDEGRELNAHNAMLWRAMMEMPSCGVRMLDLGGVNTHDLAGISRFKLGAGGQVVTLPGTFF